MRLERGDERGVLRLLDHLLHAGGVQAACIILAHVAVVRVSEEVGLVSGAEGARLAAALPLLAAWSRKDFRVLEVDKRRRPDVGAPHVPDVDAVSDPSEIVQNCFLQRGVALRLVGQELERRDFVLLSLEELERLGRELEQLRAPADLRLGDSEDSGDLRLAAPELLQLRDELRVHQRRDAEADFILGAGDRAGVGLRQVRVDECRHSLASDELRRLESPVARDAEKRVVVATPYRNRLDDAETLHAVDEFLHLRVRRLELLGRPRIPGRVLDPLDRAVAAGRALARRLCFRFRFCLHGFCPSLFFPKLSSPVPPRPICSL